MMPVSLHTHSSYSLLEAVSSPAALLARAAACGMTTLALTDTNNFYGAVSFVAEAKRLGVRPLLGACLRLGDQRVVALIADSAGYRGLCRILSRLHLDAAEPGRAARSLADHLIENSAGLHLLLDKIGRAS